MGVHFLSQTSMKPQMRSWLETWRKKSFIFLRYLIFLFKGTILLKNFWFVFSRTQKIVTHVGLKINFLFLFFRWTGEDTGEKTDANIFSCENFPSWTSCECCNTVLLWSPQKCFVDYESLPDFTSTWRWAELLHVLLQWSRSCAHSNKTIQQALSLMFFHFF